MNTRQDIAALDNYIKGGSMEAPKFYQMLLKIIQQHLKATLMFFNKSVPATDNLNELFKDLKKNFPEMSYFEHEFDIINQSSVKSDDDSVFYSLSKDEIKRFYTTAIKVKEIIIKKLARSGFEIKL